MTSNMYNARIAQEIEDQRENDANPPRESFDDFLKEILPKGFEADPDDQRNNEQNI